VSAKTMPCPNELGPMLTNVVIFCHSLALKATDGPIPFGEPNAKQNRDPGQLFEGQNR
jgi:hypothetical protein